MNKTRLYNLMQAFLLTVLAAALPSAAWAQFGGGSGTQYSPYIISTTDHMTELANNVNGGNDYKEVFFRLDADLDYSGKTYHVIGYEENNEEGWIYAFRGNFDGNGHTISNVTIGASGRTSAIGLFGILGNGGVVKNLTLGGTSSIKGQANVGGIAGKALGTKISKAYVHNCHVESGVTIETKGPANIECIGGIVGLGDLCEVKSCTNAATIKDNYNNSYAVGGIAGCLPIGWIEDCVNSGFVSGYQAIGGIVGRAGYVGSSSSNVYLRNNVNLASVTGSTDVGGVVGYNRATLVFTGNAVGDNCTIGAMGVNGSTQGTDEGYAVKHIYSCKFPSSYDGGTYITSPYFTFGGNDYFVAGDSVEFSELHTFGNTAADKMWQFVAFTADNEKYTLLLTDHGTWAFTMPAKNVEIYSTIASNITLRTFTLSTQTPLAFTGENVRPTITIWDSRGAKYLKEGTDFITNIPAEGYKDCGRYPFTIWGINDYGGRIDTAFVIAMPWQGKGTMAEPYLIYTTDDFDALSALTHKGYDQKGVYFEQMATLDYSGKTFTPTGGFSGVFTNYTTSVFTGVNISGDVRHAALFGYVGNEGAVRNVYLENSSFSSTRGDARIGGIAGTNFGEVSGCRAGSGVSLRGTRAGGFVSENQGSVSGCEFSGTLGYNDVTNAVTLGGIVGNNLAGDVQGTFFGTISASAATNSKIGGIVGSNGANTSGANFGNMKVGGTGNIVGGIVGLNQAGRSVVQHSVSDCLMKQVSGTGNIGGIVGLNGKSQSGIITNCYYIGACKYSGVNNADVVGQAMRGWPISTSDAIYFSPIPDASDNIIGTYYDDGTNNYYYVGAGETLRFVLYGGINYTANGTSLAVAGHDDDYGEDYYELTMPAKAVYIAPVGLTLTLYDKMVNFDNAGYIAAADGEQRDVIIDGRTFYKDGEWNTLCLPFAIDDLTGTPLEGATIMELDTDGINGLDPATGTLHLTFKDTTAIAAGKPYIIKWTSGTDITDPVFKGVTVNAAQPAEVTAQSAGYGAVTFKGTYMFPWVSAYDKTQLFLTTGDKLVYPTEERRLLPFRAWFVVDESIANNVRGFSLDFDNGNPSITGIGATNVAPSATPSAIYDLQGRRVAQPQKGGIYIINGKKVVY
ncbi:hypothetical protein [Pseudoprevotella muciniphila]|nr:hypothetical protein [Pseudoprevotella muciniphila]